MFQPQCGGRPGGGGGGECGHRHPVQGPADGEAGRDAGAHQVTFYPGRLPRNFGGSKDSLIGSEILIKFILPLLCF